MVGRVRFELTKPEAPDLQSGGFSRLPTYPYLVGFEESNLHLVFHHKTFAVPLVYGGNHQDYFHPAFGTPGGIRTHNPLIKSQLHYRCATGVFWYTLGESNPP